MERMKQYRDYYFKKAKQENYPARSVYKLQEMDKAHKLLRAGQKVLDLGFVSDEKRAELSVR